MTRRHCDTGRTECPHIPECIWECHYDNAGVKGEARFENTVITQPELVRKIKPWPVVPADIDPVSDQWQTVGRFFIGAVFAAITVFFALVFFTGVYVWSLLI